MTDKAALGNHDFPGKLLDTLKPRRKNLGSRRV
jgi:hypothetical protein